jgi:hypothetical protein
MFLINKTRAIEALKLAGLPRELLKSIPFCVIGGEQMFDQVSLISLIRSVS